MTNKKKDSLFSKLKSKLFGSGEKDDFEVIDDELDQSELEDYETRYHDDDDDDEEIEGDKTDPGFVLSEEINDSEEDASQELSFSDHSEESEFAEETDEDEILEALEAEVSLSLDEDSSDDFQEEPFVAEPMIISEDIKAEIEEEMEELEEEFPEMPVEMPKPERTREIQLDSMRSELEEDQESQEAEPDDEYYNENFSEFKVPGSKITLKGRALAAFAAITSMVKGKGKKPSFTPEKPSFFKFPENFDWDGIYNKIFSTEARPAIHRGFLALLFAISTYGVGKIAALAIKGSEVQSVVSSSPSMPNVSYQARPAMNTVASTDLFNAPGEPKDIDPLKQKVTKKIDEKKVCATSDTKSSLSITLVNTLVLQDSVKSIAAVQIRNDNEVLNIREGEKIKDMAEIGRIDRQKMVFKNLKTGTCEYISNIDKDLKRMTPLEILNPTAGKKLMKSQTQDGIKNAGNSYKIPGKVREEMLTNISEVLTQARAIQINNPDGSLSFKITEIVPNSIYSKLDIQNDDIVQTINGKKITNINEVMTLFGNIRQVDHFELGIIRNGAEVGKEYDFE